MALIKLVLWIFEEECRAADFLILLKSLYPVTHEILSNGLNILHMWQ